MNEPLLISLPHSESHSLVHVGSLPREAVCWSFSVEKNPEGHWEILLTWVDSAIHRVALATYTSEALAGKDIKLLSRSLQKHARSLQTAKDKARLQMEEILERNDQEA